MTDRHPYDEEPYRRRELIILTLVDVINKERDRALAFARAGDTTSADRIERGIVEIAARLQAERDSLDRDRFGGTQLQLFAA
jgi:hypothetical protein